MPAAADGGLVKQADVHDQIDGAGDQAVGEHVADAQPGSHAQGDKPIDRMARGPGMQCAQAAVPGVHRLEHRQHLITADLADDDPAQVHPQRRPHQVAEGHLACTAPGSVTFAGPFARLQHDPPVPLGQLVQVQLVLALDGREPLQRGELVGQRPDQGRLPRSAGR